MNKRNMFVFAVLFPLLILLAMAVKPLTTMLYGQDILLQTRAVDPNDLFRGDYVSLAYKISDVPKEMLPDSVKNPTEKPLKNLTLYVSLKPEGRFYVIDTISENKPKDGIYLKGLVRYYDYYNMPGTVFIEYTLDKYFVKQGSGIKLQEQSQKGELIGKARVLNGYAILTDIQETD
ncbi:MAG TPA: GDYXXLXY domain-containing protein [Verrucomicrobiae bacterium]|nr:GDYXXLXY domain-containing protein [Verrucomicrobiae bacterium]